MAEVRVGIVGSAGTGKTSLASRLSSDLGVAFLEAKEITLDVLRRDGYDYGSGVQIERFLAQEGRQEEIFYRTLDAERSAGSFVTDRTLVDLAAYFVAELHDVEPMKVEKYVSECREAAKYTHLILCPWGRTPLLDNRRRTLNPWYQMIIHGLELTILHTWGMSYMNFEGGYDQLLQAIRAYLS